MLPSSLRHTQVREVGAARLLCAQAQQLALRDCLAACDLRPRHVRLGLAQILARALHPASERETLRWLQHDSALGELLGLRPGDLAKDALYAAADALWEQHEAIETRLFDHERKLFGLEPRIVFYDLTNTFHTGRPRHALAARGRSKQKRHDAPLVTLALLLDGEGFPRRSEVLKGNVGESTTLQAAVKSLRLGGQERPTVIFDAGIVSAGNLQWLGEQGLHWITMDRRREAPPEREPDSRWTSAGGEELKVWRLSEARSESDGPGRAAQAGQDKAREARLCVWSPARDRDEREMLRRTRERYEAELRSLHEGLTIPRRLKSYDKVLRKVGRLESKHTLVASQYTVRVEREVVQPKKGKAKRGKRASAVHWERSERYRRRELQRGTSLMRTSRVDWDDSRIVWEYFRLAEIESCFRAMKQDLGLRPMHHQLQRRVSGHLFITVLAYHVVHALRRELSGSGIRYSWKSIRDRMGTWVRLTTTMRTAAGKVWSQRQDGDPNSAQARIAAAAGVAFRRHRQLLGIDLSQAGESAADKEGQEAKSQQSVVTANVKECKVPTTCSA